MATVKVKFRSSSVSGKEGTVFYQVIHRRVVRQIHSGLHIYDSEWDAGIGNVRSASGCDLSRARHLSAVKERINNDLSRLKAIVSTFEKSGNEYTADEVSSTFSTPLTVVGVISYARKLIDDMRRIGKTQTARRFELSLNSFFRFTRNEEVAWQDFTSTLLLGYEEFLRRRGLCRNSTSYYMRTLRSIINRAIEDEYDVPRNPFRHVYMGIDKTVKRAVSLKTVCRIRDMDLSAFPHLEFARDLFLFAFFTRGMSFVDIAFLKKSDMTGGVLTYFRRKTSQQIQVRLEEPTRAIMAKLGTSTTSYLLPIITSETDDAYSQYRAAYHRVNRNLKKVGEMLGLDIKLTMYVARHAWASIAHKNNVPVSTISKAMGHDSETTTMIYLSSLDSSVVDKANKKILSLMNSASEEWK